MNSYVGEHCAVGIPLENASSRVKISAPRLGFCRTEPNLDQGQFGSARHAHAILDKMSVRPFLLLAVLGSVRFSIFRTVDITIKIKLY